MLFNAVSADALSPTGSRISAVCNFIFTWIDHAHFICGIPRNEYHLYMTPQYQPVHIYKKMSADLVFHLVLLFAPISHFPVYTSPNVLFSMYDMFTSFSFIVQTLRICCDAGECIFSVVHPSYETGVITLSLCVIVL